MYNTALFLSIICLIFTVSSEVNAQDHENVEQVGLALMGSCPVCGTRSHIGQLWKVKERIDLRSDENGIKNIPREAETGS